MGEHCESWRRLGISLQSISRVKRRDHPAKMVGENLALALFSRPSDGGTMVALWSLSANQAVSSINLSFSWSMMWDWDWRAEAIQKAFEELCPPRPEEVAVPTP